MEAGSLLEFFPNFVHLVPTYVPLSNIPISHSTGNCLHLSLKNVHHKANNVCHLILLDKAASLSRFKSIFPNLPASAKTVVRELSNLEKEREKMAETVVDFLLEDLKLILSHSTNLNVDEKDQIEYLYEELQFMKEFLSDSEEPCKQHEELKRVATQIRDVACKAFHEFESFVVGGFIQKDEKIAGKIGSVINNSHKLRNFVEEIKYIKEEVLEIYRKKMYGIGVPKVAISSVESFSTVSNPFVEVEEVVVGFDDEAMVIMDQLTCVAQKQLEVISIVGMAGIGKTTLARKLYNDPLIIHHFYVRGWTSVSQVFRKKDVLLRILNSILQNKDYVHSLSEESLGEELYRRLKGNRYMIVIDDIWDTGPWEDLRKSFPNDGNGSRIMVTTQLQDVALNINHNNSPPHCLDFLSQDKSWDLLKQKTFHEKENCPLELIEIGKEIAAKCQGLPLAIVVVAGLLAKTEKIVDWWKQVAENISSHISGDTEQFMSILALSYNHLPHHLKSCFIYFGAFPEDYEIPAWRLIWLWIAEGFVQQTGQRSLEDVAEDYLRDLVDRSLVLAAQKSSKGGIKVCRIHDMLRNLCLNKAGENNFLEQIDWWSCGLGGNFKYWEVAES